MDRMASSLRHPGPKFEVRASMLPSGASSWAGSHGIGRPQQEPGQMERVVSVLLRELAETRKEKMTSAAQLQAYKDECLSLLRQQGSAKRGADGKQAPARGQQAIKAFRPPGMAPPPPQQKAVRRTTGTKGGCASPRAECCASEDVAKQVQQAEALASLHLDNTYLRQQVAALEAKLAHVQLAPAQQTTVAVRPASPGPTRTTVTVSSPGRGEEQVDSLTVAVFEPPSADVGELRRQLNKLQRDNLKLSSKVKATEAELANKSITAKRWEEACDVQAAQVAALKVDLEQERRYQRQLEETLEQAGSECNARDADVASLLVQLRSAEQAAAAARGEAAALRSQLAQMEGLLVAAQEEAQGVRETLDSTSARLQASELVRHDAERERDELAAANERLQAEQQRAESEALALQAAVATLQQQINIESQRSAMLQEQVRMVEQQGRETEELLSEQLRTVQEERNACLAAATRADALLIKLGSHAWQLKDSGSDVQEHLAS